MGSEATHWDEVWTSKAPDETSWFQTSPQPCSELIRAHSQPTSYVAIVGAGASSLVVDLATRGYRRIEAVDISAAALDRLRAELAGIPAPAGTAPAGTARPGRSAAALEVAAAVTLRQADVRTVTFDQPVDIWHDRATFHFLTDPADRTAYAASAAGAVRPGGHAIVATFAPDGPEQCSGLPVARYDALSLAAELGRAFTLVEAQHHQHQTPWGATQPFVYALLRRTAS